MPVDPRLPGLMRLSTMVKELHLADLRRAEAERQALIDHIATLSQRPEAPADIPPAIAVEVAMRYDRWAELRRREVEQALAAKTAECDRLRARARQSVGRDGALVKLVAKG